MRIVRVKLLTRALLGVAFFMAAHFVTPAAAALDAPAAVAAAAAER